ncbi:MAG: alanine--tRNA ligase [Gammaproteobacteria bacterium]|nr:MAG: alanine--tRNA ligase [Gammaproteobacteria bacterium]
MSKVPTSTNELRSAFLEFFRKNDHEVVSSSSLVPHDDPTLLFTNAGMVQFKDVFLGKEKRPYVRATSSQRCVRAGGKHNDLDEVGYTSRHHTFFEMLGNFSFGDYFKKEAIRYAWDFLTKVTKLPGERIWVTVFEDDDEAAEIWHTDIGVPKDRIIRKGAKDNFWAMGETGPCGPCTEIFYDHGADLEGGPPGSKDEDGDRYVEVWNLVFMQFDRNADGEMGDLPKVSVDTGMGLERLAAIMQGVHSNYEIDLFKALIKVAARLTGTRDLHNKSLNVISDHIRACAFLIADGVLPSNEGRGYVLRRIIRRAIRHGYMLGQDKPFFWKMVKPLGQQMGEAYPELVEQRAHIEKVLSREEDRFAETLDQGMRLLEDAIASMKGKTIPGETVFKLYDTYGFPVDLTADVARERNLKIDEKGFEKAMAAQRERGKQASGFKVAYESGAVGSDATPTEFLGYDELDTDGLRIMELLVNGKPVDKAKKADEVIVILDRTPFYAESGGQTGDAGTISGDGVEFTVSDTRKINDVQHAHVGKLKNGSLHVGQKVRAAVDAQRRCAIVLNHSATHLMHAALREVLGSHVQQKGSLVAPDRLRFDFSHYEPVTLEQMREIERLVNDEIRKNAAADVKVLSYNEAIKAGALAFFGEKYGDRVRVMKFGDFSVELCGGTHVTRVGDIGFFKITSESGIAAGVRRIEAVTGGGAEAWVENAQSRLSEIAGLVKSGGDDVADKVRQLVARAKTQERELSRLKQSMASSAGDDLAQQAVDVKGLKVVAAQLDAADAKTLRETLDHLKNKLKSAAIVLAGVEGGTVRLVAGVTDDHTDRIKAGELVNSVAEQVGGKGGGRPDMAQAGGNKPEALPEALAGVPDWVRARLQ